MWRLIWTEQRWLVLRDMSQRVGVGAERESAYGIPCWYFGLLLLLFKSGRKVMSVGSSNLL